MPSPTLSSARTEQEILEAIARFTWWEHFQTECPDYAIPTSDILARFVENHPEGASGTMPVTPQEMFGERGLWFVLRHPGKERFIAICIETLIEENETINDKYATLLVPDPPEPIEYEEGMSHAMISYDIPAIHARWLNEAKSENLEHPVAALTAAWQKTQPLHVKQDQNNNAIMPQTFAIVRDIHLAEGALFAELPASTRPGFKATNSQEDLFADLPGFEPRGRAAVPSLLSGAFRRCGRGEHGPRSWGTVGVAPLGGSNTVRPDWFTLRTKARPPRDFPSRPHPRALAQWLDGARARRSQTATCPARGAQCSDSVGEWHVGGSRGPKHTGHAQSPLPPGARSESPAR